MSVDRGHYSPIQQYGSCYDNQMILEGCTEQTRTVLVKANTIRARHVSIFCYLVSVDKVLILCHLRERDKFIAPHHVLLALLENEHISAIIADHDVSVDAIADVIRKLRSKPVTDPDSKPRFELLNELVASLLTTCCSESLSRFATDVTKLAEEGVIGPVIGRVCHHYINISKAVILTGLQRLAKFGGSLQSSLDCGCLIFPIFDFYPN